MTMKYALCGIALAVLVTPALAANEFYVVQDAAKKGCSIVEQKPTVATTTIIGAVYDTQAKAEAAMKADKNCDAK